jgi:hypothetical protein
MLFLYYILYITILYVIYHLYFCYTNRFWCKQPVFHYHYLNYWIRPPKVIWKDGFPLSKYYSEYITHSYIEKLDETTKEALFTIINDNFYRSDEGYYEPTKESIFSQFNYDDCVCYNKIGDMITSCIFSKNLLMNHKGNIHTIQNIDYLCTHPSQRKKGITPKMIYSIAFNNNKYTRNNIFLFKKEYNLQSYVPLTKYPAVCYKMNTKLFTTTKVPPEVSSVRITPENHDVFTTYLESVERNVVILFQEKDIIFNLKNKDLYFYLVYVKNKPQGLIGFRNSYTYYNSNKNTISKNEDSNKNKLLIEVFCVHSFSEFLSMDTLVKVFYTKVSQELPSCNFVLVEGLCDGKQMQTEMTRQNDILYETQFAYYLYNYADYSVICEDCLIIT